MSSFAAKAAAQASRAGSAIRHAAVKKKSFVVWFRGTDLRVDDNEVLSVASSYRGVKDVLPVYVFDPRCFAVDARYGSARKSGEFRARFLIESVQDLRASLQRLGSGLVVAVGKPEVVLPRIVGQMGGSDVSLVFQEEAGTEERAVERAVKRGLGRGVGVTCKC